MNTLNKIITYGSIALVGLTGCAKNNSSEKIQEPVPITSLVNLGYGQPMVAVGDVTGDGKNDIVYADKDGVFYMSNTGNGTYGLRVKAGSSGSLGYGQPSVAVGDVTGDGLADIVLGNKDGIFVLKNVGNGKFQE